MPNNKSSNHPSPQLIDYLTTHDPHEAFRGSQYAPSFGRAQAMAQSLQAWDDAWARMSTQKGEGAQGMVKAPEGKGGPPGKDKQQGK